MIKVFADKEIDIPKDSYPCLRGFNLARSPEPPRWIWAMFAAPNHGVWLQGTEAGHIVVRDYLDEKDKWIRAPKGFKITLTQED